MPLDDVHSTHYSFDSSNASSYADPARAFATHRQPSSGKSLPAKYSQQLCNTRMHIRPKMSTSEPRGNVFSGKT